MTVGACLQTRAFYTRQQCAEGPCLHRCAMVLLQSWMLGHPWASLTGQRWQWWKQSATVRQHLMARSQVCAGLHSWWALIQLPGADHVERACRRRVLQPCRTKAQLCGSPQAYWELLLLRLVQEELGNRPILPCATQVPMKATALSSRIIVYVIKPFLAEFEG